jgi:CRP-like cAMP-binding protein
VDLERWHGVPASQGQNQRDIDLALSQADLAGLVGSSLESAAKAIREFAAQDILRTRRRRVTILDCAALRQIAGQ